MDERAEHEVLATHAVYLKAFRANDVPAINELIQYPLAHIGYGQTGSLIHTPSNSLT